MVSGWGWGTEKLWEGLCSGGTAVAPFDRFDTAGYATLIAAEVPDPPASFGARFRHWGHLSYADRFAVAAAVEAVESAGLPRDLGAADAGVLFGGSTGGMFETERFYRELDGRTVSRTRVGAVASQQADSPGNAAARELRASGPVQTVSSACSSATLAIGLGLEAIREAAAEVVVVGGADSLCEVTYAGFNSLRAVDREPCRPFRADRAGLSLGEGGAALVLESLDSARTRGAEPIAELLGAGTATDAYHLTAPDPQGRSAALALTHALKDAGRAPGCVDFINAHGTGTERNDLAEFKALEQVFGPERARTIPVVATKASVGHLLGSAGALEAVATVLCLEHQQLHATPGSGEIDPRTPVHLFQQDPPTGPLRIGASLNLAFGGCNGALLIGQWNPS